MVSLSISGPKGSGSLKIMCGIQTEGVHSDANINIHPVEKTRSKYPATAKRRVGVGQVAPREEIRPIEMRNDPLKLALLGGVLACGAVLFGAPKAVEEACSTF